MGGSAAGWTCALLVAAAVGCAPRPKAELGQPVGITTSYHETIECPPTAASARPVRAADRECELPSFVFAEGSAVITPSEDRELGRIARCLTTGALAGTSVIAVGHADPVGGDRENLDLGLRRAATIRDFLVARGVASERVLATSAGARATAANVPGERVDLMIVTTQPTQRVE